MSSPLYAKRAARHDFIEIDGTDYSNAFRQMELNSSHASLPAGGFSVSGKTETVAGETTQGFTGEAFTNEALLGVLAEIHLSQDVVLVRWQKNGLVGSGEPLFYGNCRIDEFNPGSTFGELDTIPVVFATADADGIRMTGT